MMDFGQLLVALIGATSTLLAAVVGSRSRFKPGVVPSKRSLRRRLIKFGFYFLLGGVATYWVMSWLLPNNPIDVQSHLSDVYTNRISRSGSAFAQGLDSIVPPVVPIGTVLLSVLSPDMHGGLPGGSDSWTLADGRTLDSSSLYATLTGRTSIPDLRGLPISGAVADTSSADSAMRSPRQSITNQVGGHPTLYWYIRVR